MEQLVLQDHKEILVYRDIMGSLGSLRPRIPLEVYLDVKEIVGLLSTGTVFREVPVHGPGWPEGPVGPGYPFSPAFP